MPYWVRLLFVTGSADQVGEALAAHREQVRELREAGRLRVGGELGAGDGFLEIFEAEDRMQAEGLCRSSPLVEAGLAGWMLREWSEISREP